MGDAAAREDRGEMEELFMKDPNLTELAAKIRDKVNELNVVLDERRKVYKQFDELRQEAESAGLKVKWSFADDPPPSGKLFQPPVGQKIELDVITKVVYY